MIFLILLLWQLYGNLLTISTLQPDDPSWILQQRNVCFGAGTDSEFTLGLAGLLTGLKLEHLHSSSSQLGKPGDANDRCVQTNISVDVQVMGVSLYGPSSGWECGDAKSLSYILQVSTPKFFNAGKHNIQVLRLGPTDDNYVPFFREDICFDVYVRTRPLRPVTINLKTSACGTCGTALKTSECPSSSIEVNEEEVSLLEDGFNILLVDPNRTVSKSVSFGSNEERGFIEFFASIPVGTVFAIVLQNMCQFNSTSWWFRYLVQHENVTSLSDAMSVDGANNRVGIVVGCKGFGCVDIWPKLPYSYVGDGLKVEVVYQYSTVFTFLNPYVKTDKVVSSGSGELGNASTSIIFFMVVTLLSLVLVGLFIFKRRRGERNPRPKTDGHSMPERPSATEDATTKTEEYGYSAFSDVNKSAEHIYAYVDPQMLRNGMDDSTLALPMTSRPSQHMCQRNKPSNAESSGAYMAPSSIPKYNSPTLGVPTIRPSSNSDTSLPTVYEAMGCYPEGSVANVTYEEISTTHRKVPNRQTSDELSTSNDSSSSQTDDEFDTSNGTDPSSPQVSEEMYVNVGPFRTYSNGSQYISLATGETVDIGEPLYQRISFEEYNV